MKRRIKPLTGKFGDFSGIVLKSAAAGHVQAVLHYLKLHPKWLNQEGPHGRTLLWEAAYRGRNPMIEKLIELGANVRPIGSYYTPMLIELTALATAVYRGHEDTARLLRKHGARDDFWAACHRGDLTKVSKTLKRNPKYASRPIKKEVFHPRMGWDPIHYAVAGQQPQVLETLFKHGAQIGQHYELLNDWSEGHRQTTRILKEQIKKETPTGSLPRKKRGKGKAIDQPDFMGYPPLVDACRGNHNAQDTPERVLELLDRGASVNITDYKGKTPLHRAGQAGFLKITQILIDRGGDLEIADKKGGTPIFDAATYGRTKTVELMIKNGANLEHCDSRNETPLFAAVRKQRTETVKAILKANANREHQNRRDQTVLEVVTCAKQTDARREIAILLR